MFFGLQYFRGSMSTVIPGSTIIFLEEHIQRVRGPGVARERTRLQIEVDRRHSSLCWVWRRTVETRREPQPGSGPGSGLSVVGGHPGGSGKCAHIVSGFIPVEPTAVVARVEARRS